MSLGLRSASTDMCITDRRKPEALRHEVQKVMKGYRIDRVLMSISLSPGVILVSEFQIGNLGNEIE
jgi:hypothetical protein